MTATQQAPRRHSGRSTSRYGEPAPSQGGPRPSRYFSDSGRGPSNGNERPGGEADARPRASFDEAKTLFQTYFKSVGPRTYAAQLKEAANGNHFLLLTEGRRDEKTGKLFKSTLLVWSDDFVPFFQLLRETAQFIKTNPVPEKVRRRQQQMWAKKRNEAEGKSNGAADDARAGAPTRGR